MMPNSFLYDWSPLASYSSSRLNFKVKPSSLPGYVLVMSSVNFAENITSFQNMILLQEGRTFKSSHPEK